MVQRSSPEGEKNNILGFVLTEVLNLTSVAHVAVGVFFISVQDFKFGI